MAHEISHSFDELGNIYDAEGRLGNWWTQKDLKQYHAASVKLAAQFRWLLSILRSCVNGNHILSLKGKSDIVTNGLTGEQRFFVAFSQRCCKLQSEPMLRRQVKSDPH